MNASSSPSPSSVGAAQPVTLLITRRVLAGHEAAFELAMASVLTAARGFAGHLGGHLLRPGNGAADAERGLYHVLFAFETQAQLDAWQHSAERRALLGSVRPHLIEEIEARPVPGLELWFAPAAASPHKPPRWKIAVVTWLGICPTVWVLLSFVAPWLASWPSVPRVMLLTALVVVLMTWWIAPFLTRRLSGWLHAAAPR